MGLTQLLDPASSEMVDAMCPGCSRPYKVARFVFEVTSGRADRLPRCDECTAATKAAEKATQNENAADRHRALVDEVLERVVPREHSWASFEALAKLDTAERSRRVRDPTGVDRAKVVAAGSDPWVVLEGRAGVGKTTLAVCILRERMYQANRHPGGVRFVDGFQLATARAQSQLGEEAPDIAYAMKAWAAILDDICAKPCNPIHDATADVVHRRHQRGDMTIVTSGFNQSEVESRLGAGIRRRVYERAQVITLREPK